MSCEENTVRNGGDSISTNSGKRPFDKSATAWLIGQAVRYLNASDRESELSYERVVELLKRCAGDVLETVTGLLRQSKNSDPMLRWNLLHVLGDAGDHTAGDLLVRSALAKSPEPDGEEGCQKAGDIEILVSTMAVHALREIARRHPEAADRVLQVVSEKPIRPILVEAVKAARDLGLEEKVKELLSEEDRWILDIRTARVQELFAEPEREDTKERGFTAPKFGEHYTAPRFGCCGHKE